MLRETKLGIVVSCSFLSLVGVVVASKLRDQAAPAEVQAAEPENKRDQPSAPESKKGSSLASLSLAVPPPPGTVIKPEGEIKLAHHEKREPAPLSLHGPGTRKPEPDVAAPPAPTAPIASAPPAPAVPPSEPPAEPRKDPAGGMGGVALPEQALPMKEVAAPEAAAVAVVPPGGAASSEKEGKTASSPMAPGAPEAALPMPEPLAPPPTLETKEGEKKPAPLPAPPAVVEEKPGPKPAELPPALPAAPAAVPEGPPMAASPVPMLPPAAPPAAPAVVSPAGPPEAALVKPAEIPLPKPEEVGVKPPAETAPPPAADAGMKTPMPALPAVVVPDRKDVLPASIEKPPSAAAPVAVTPPVVARTAEPRSATTQPVVESYTEQEYTVKQGETFATISKAKYGSEEYAEALRRHNLDDMFRSVPLDEKGGSIKPGQIVSIPDLQFLERRYANLLPKLSPLPEVKLDPKLTRAAAIASAGKTVAAVTEGPLYRVSAGGQTMREVASKILGDGERWNQVLRLNPTFRSDYAIPAGSILTLPAGTKVPPENQVR